MDYKVFYTEVAEWIMQVNQMAVKYGMQSEAFWQWVASSISQLCNKYNNTPLVKKQMTMLFEWLEEIYEEGKTKNGS